MSEADLRREIGELRQLMERTGSRWWESIMKGVAVLALPAMAWAIHVEARITSIEATLFTKADAESMAARVAEKFPPEWLKERLLEIRGDLREVNVRLRAVETKVKR